MTHFFATQRGRRFRDDILIRDNFTCQMCGYLVKSGRRSPRSAVVDHIQPTRLRPDLEDDECNCWTVCRACHALCDGIEKRNGDDAARIAKEKAAEARFQRTGWRC